MGVMDLATIELIADDDYACISGGGFEFRDIKLDVEPEGPFSDELELKFVESVGRPGGMAPKEDYPVRELVLPFNLYDVGGGIEATVSRFRKLWRSGRSVRWQVTTGLSGTRWLDLRRSKGIKFSPARDWNLDGYATATVTAVALWPFYESPPLELTAANPSSGMHTLWFPVANPTDQRGYLQWSFKPNGTAQFAFPDFSFGNEQEIDATWLPGYLDDRMIGTPEISVMWNVRHPRMGAPYLTADLSDANGQMGGSYPLFWVPPYTDETLLPVIVDGPAGAQVKCKMRQFWSADSGLE